MGSRPPLWLHSLCSFWAHVRCQAGSSCCLVGCRTRKGAEQWPQEPAPQGLTLESMGSTWPCDWHPLPPHLENLGDPQSFSAGLEKVGSDESSDFQISRPLITCRCGQLGTLRATGPGEHRGQEAPCSHDETCGRPPGKLCGCCNYWSLREIDNELSVG